MVKLITKVTIVYYMDAFTFIGQFFWFITLMIVNLNDLCISYTQIPIYLYFGVNFVLARNQLKICHKFHDHMKECEYN